MGLPMAALAAVSESEAERRRAFELLRTRLKALSAEAALPPVEGLISTAIPQLDALLQGGFPSGAIVTLEGETGRWSLAAGLIARLTQRSLVAILDDGALYPPALAEAGALLERIIVVPVRKALAIARATDILLRSRICRLVIMPAVTLRDSIWDRLAKLVHRSGALLIVIASRAGAALSAVATVRLYCTVESAVVHGRRGLWGTVDGFEVTVGLRKHKYLMTRRTARVRIGARS